MTEFEFDLGSIMDASELAFTQVLTVYIPNRDRDGQILRNYEEWINEAFRILTLIGGGVTRIPAKGSWYNEESGREIRENTAILYTYIRPQEFQNNLPKLREFLHRFGLETNQGEVVVEFDGMFYKIREFRVAG